MLLKKSLGQHFLKDKNILAKEARLLAVRGKAVLEIGPGDGRLTEQLLLAGAKKVIAVEKDTRLVGALKERFAGCPVEILNADFLEINPQEFNIEKIAGNIPYYISSQIVFRLKEFDFEDAVIMVQDEFAKKMVAAPKSPGYGRLSVTSQLSYELKYAQKVPRHLFMPPPRVDSAIILLKKSPNRMGTREEDIIRALFSHKNKTVRNALLDAGFHKESLDKLGNLLVLRPRELELPLILEICRKLG
jgi:16S rRNA (adenine1518-N6/adenine1519-N6)-dimethyltransferase